MTPLGHPVDSRTCSRGPHCPLAQKPFFFRLTRWTLGLALEGRTVLSVSEEEQWKHAQEAPQRNSKGLCVCVCVLLDAPPECHFSHVWLTICLGGPGTHTPGTCTQQSHEISLQRQASARVWQRYRANVADVLAHTCRRLSVFAYGPDTRVIGLTNKHRRPSINLISNARRQTCAHVPTVRSAQTSRVCTRAHMGAHACNHTHAPRARSHALLADTQDSCTQCHLLGSESRLFEAHLSCDGFDIASHGNACYITNEVANGGATHG